MSSQAVLYKLAQAYDDVCHGIVDASSVSCIVDANSMSCDRNSDADIAKRLVVVGARTYVEGGYGYDGYIVDMVGDMLTEDEYEELETAFIALLEATIEYNESKTALVPTLPNPS